MSKQLFLLTVLLGAVCAQEYFKNMDYLGWGYDVVTGNPHQQDNPNGRTLDPGFKEAVFKISYDKGQKTSDQRYWVPDGCTAVPLISCSYSSDVSQITSASEYTKTLTFEAKISGEYANFSFSGSYNSMKTTTEIEKKESKYVLAKAICTSYRASVGLWSRSISPSDNFMGMVSEGLAQNLDDTDLYFEFLDTFGTHVVTVMEAGAKSVAMSQFDKTTWSKTSASTRAIGAQASFMQWSGAVNSTAQKQAAEQFDQERTQVENYVIGASVIEASGDMEKWAELAAQNPVPVVYKLQPISDVLISSLFPDVTNISAVKAKVMATMAKYCDHNPKCVRP